MTGYNKGSRVSEQYWRFPEYYCRRMRKIKGSKNSGIIGDDQANGVPHESLKRAPGISLENVLEHDCWRVSGSVRTAQINDDEARQ